MSLENTLTPKMKKKGDRGSPCLSPLPGKMNPKGLPFRRMEKEGVEMQTLIQEIQIELNPNLSKMASKKFHSILSKAFSMSIFKNMKPPFPLLALKK
jgi:hypothetical protein